MSLYSALYKFVAKITKLMHNILALATANTLKRLVVQIINDNYMQVPKVWVIFAIMSLTLTKEIFLMRSNMEISDLFLKNFPIYLMSVLYS